MAISTKLIRKQIALFKPIVSNCTIETARAAQTAMGNFMAGTHKTKVRYSPHVFRNFTCEWVIPKTQKLDGVILYFHGGGYAAGGIAYARGFGTILAAKNNMRVFCVAYRLAPENPYPAALEDALTAYEHLLESGYPADKIILCGESAGGSLIYALTLKLKELSLPMPCGLIALSPWCDLTQSGDSHNTNRDNDPSLTKERLDFFATLYSDDPQNPYVSPLFGDLKGFPPSIIIAGGHEILLDDSVRLHEKLIACGCTSELLITPEMWHVYILYGVKEGKNDHLKISTFVMEALNGPS